MPAMGATLESTGTWTAISFNTTKASKTEANVPNLEDINLESLKDADTGHVTWPELDQFVQLVADGYNISHWSAAKLVAILIGNKMRGWVPDVGSRTYP